MDGAGSPAALQRWLVSGRHDLRVSDKTLARIVVMGLDAAEVLAHL
jgi:hypothetical protein